MSRCYDMRWYQNVDTALYIKNASIFCENLRVSQGNVLNIRLILSLTERLMCLSGLATHESIENASERPEMALNRILRLIIVEFTKRI